MTVERGIVNQKVDFVKTDGSVRTFVISKDLLERLKAHRSRADFSEPTDWIFASPIRLGRRPYSYTGVCRELHRAAGKAGVGHLGTPAFRHTHRSWLDAVGTSLTVQQKMMRHTDIRTTMGYGDVVTDEMLVAGEKVAQIAFPANRALTERDGS